MQYRVTTDEIADHTILVSSRLGYLDVQSVSTLPNGHLAVTVTNEDGYEFDIRLDSRVEYLATT